MICCEIDAPLSLQICVAMPGCQVGESQCSTGTNSAVPAFLQAGTSTDTHGMSAN